MPTFKFYGMSPLIIPLSKRKIGTFRIEQPLHNVGARDLVSYHQLLFIDRFGWMSSFNGFGYNII